MTRRTYNKDSDYRNPGEIQGYEKVIVDLEKKIFERSNTPEGSGYTFSTNSRSKATKVYYAEELKKQIEAKNNQKELEKAEKYKPAISESFHGYPNIPQTPRYLKRQRELEQKKAIRDDLITQLQSKKNEEVILKSNKIESERRSNNEDIFRMNEDRAKKYKKKENEKEILVNA